MTKNIKVEDRMKTLHWRKYPLRGREEDAYTLICSWWGLKKNKPNKEWGKKRRLYMIDEMEDFETNIKSFKKCLRRIKGISAMIFQAMDSCGATNWNGEHCALSDWVGIGGAIIWPFTQQKKIAETFEKTRVVHSFCLNFLLRWLKFLYGKGKVSKYDKMK